MCELPARGDIRHRLLKTSPKTDLWRDALACLPPDRKDGLAMRKLNALERAFLAGRRGGLYGTIALRLLVTGGVWLMAGAPVLGHHLFPRESGAPILITGTVARFEMRNPHPLIVLEVRDASVTRDQPRSGPVPDREVRPAPLSAE